MVIQDLSKNLKNVVKPFYLISGDDYYFKKTAVSLFKALVDEMTFDFNITYFNSSMTADALLINLQTPPLMSDYRLVLFSGDGKKLDKEKAKSYESKIKDWLKNPCPNVILVIVDDDDSFKFLSKIAEVVDCKKQKIVDLIPQVANYISEKGFSANDATIKELINKCNNDMMIISNELEKLFAIADNKSISYDMIDKIVVNNIEQSVFKLTDSIALGNIGEAYVIMDTLLASGEQPLKILATIAGQYRRMFVCKVSQDSEAALAEQLGVNPYAVTISKRVGKSYKPMQLKKLVDKMSNIEYAAKNGEIGILEGLNLAFIYACNRR